MKKIILTMLVLSLSTLFCADKVFKLAHDSYAPFHWYDQNSQKSIGIFIDICDELIGRRMGYKIEYKEYPWKRAQVNVAAGIEDAFISLPTTERKEYTVSGLVPFIVMTRVIFTQPDNPYLEKLKTVKNVKDLKALPKLQILDYIGDGWGEKNLEQLLGFKLDKVALIDQVVNKLSVKRGDVFIEEPLVVNYKIREYKLERNIIQLTNSLDNTEFKLCISKKSTFVNEVENVDKHLTAMVKDGTMAKILKKWGTLK